MTRMPDSEKKDHPMLSGLKPSRVKKGKIVTAEEAIQVIHPGDTLAFGGFVGIGVAEKLAITLQEKYTADRTPSDLTVIYSAGMGDGRDKGLNHLGIKGLVKRVIGGHWGLVPAFQKLAIENEIEAYNLPQGVITQMYRDIAAKKPRTITTVGLKTFVDPRMSGGKLNAMTQEEMVELMVFDGKEYLAYKTLPGIDVAFLRGTTADTDGNITMEKEALTLDSLSIAMAAKNSGGFVIVQVERITESGGLNPRQVKIPGILVDCVVVSEPEYHWQTFAAYYNPHFSSEIRQPMQSITAMAMDARKIIARRAAFELSINAVVNLGIGMPEGIAQVASEEKILDFITLTAEPGVIGGIPQGGLNFGAAVNAGAIVDQPYQFDFYDGGGLDIAFLGLAQADQNGNLNVSKFGPKLAGAGGFINISQNAKRVVFVGTFTAKDLAVTVTDGRLAIDREGRFPKFLQQVEHVTFSGEYAVEQGLETLFITERCVFKLTPDGLELIEIAPGMDLDLEKNILRHMAFKPIIKGAPKIMDQRIFLPEPMGLKEDLMKVPLARRLTYDKGPNRLFINFEGLSVNTVNDLETIYESVRHMLAPVGKKVYAIVNYDNFTIHPDCVAPYTEMVKKLANAYYLGVTRYTTSAFLRMKLGKSLSDRNVAPHIYESSHEAGSALEKMGVRS